MQDRGRWSDTKPFQSQNWILRARAGIIVCGRIISGACCRPDHWLWSFVVEFWGSKLRELSKSLLQIVPVWQLEPVPSFPLSEIWRKTILGEKWWYWYRLHDYPRHAGWILICKNYQHFRREIVYWFNLRAMYGAGVKPFRTDYNFLQSKRMHLRIPGLLIRVFRLLHLIGYQSGYMEL